MFLRRNRKTIGGVDYDYWTLCEAVRTSTGPRQRVVASLGKFFPDAPGSEHGWEHLDALLEGRPAEQQLNFGQASAQGPKWELADLSNLRVEHVRDFGSVWLGLSLWHRLGLHKLLDELMPEGREDVRWSKLAAVLTVARFCGQVSELGIAEHWYETTAMEDITGITLDKINDDRLYRGLDELGARKKELCAHLMKRYESWFGVRFEFLLYDVTSTFFEGSAEENPQAQRGYSRDNRPDCKQVCIGLVCTPEGLPLSFEVFDGNRADVTTVEDIVAEMEKTYGQAERIWVMDRGMVSEKNIGYLRNRKARYLVGTPKSDLRHFEAALLEKEDWTQVQDGLEARLIKHPDGEGDEQYVLCRSTARAEKERAMLRRQEDLLVEEIMKIDRRLRNQAEPDVEKVGRRIGRWLGRYPAAGKIVEVVVERSEEGHAEGLVISSRLDRGRKASGQHGAYLLRTNCTETDPAQLWKWYIQLTQAEAAFRTAKSDLKLRPIYHRKTERVQAHILVCFLALALWRVLEQWMQGKQLGSCARKLIREISTIKSMDVLVPVKRGDERLTLTVRTVARPDRHVAELLSRLGLQLPSRNLIFDQNVVEKNAH